MTVGKIGILLVDDHTVLRAGLRSLLNNQPDMEVVGEAGDGREAVVQVREVRPDIVLMDIGMPGVNGLDATRLVKQADPGVRVLVLSMYDDESYLRGVLQAGASGYVLKNAADVELLSAIRAVHRGEIYLYPSLAKLLMNDLLGRETGGRGAKRGDVAESLSPREEEVLRLVARGYTNQQIAEMLFLSVKTVETHKSRIMEKLKIKGRAQLVRYAVEKGLFTVNPSPDPL